MYDVIVLGASFAAAGIAEICRKNCLVLERRMQAGYEFFGALQFGTGYEKPLRSEKAKELRAHFEKNAYPFGNDPLLYPIFKQSDILFGTETVFVEKRGEHFVCTTHGVDGYRTYEAKRVIDTRCHPENCSSKRFNVLIESKEEPQFNGIACTKADTEGRYVLHIPVSLTCTFSEAAKKTLELVQAFSPAQKLILSANEFDYEISQERQEKDEILFLPSKAYENPIAAFEAGLICGEEMNK